MADTPVNVTRSTETRDGQAQEKTTFKPHDGRHFVDELVAITDRVITDVKDELAVQVPKDVGASTAGHKSPLGEALAVGTPQEQFDAAAKDDKKK